MFDYIKIDDLKDFYGFTPDEDQQEFTNSYINFSNERINALSGNKIESIGFDNLSEIQQQLVKKACARYAWWLFVTGQQWARTNISQSTASQSSSTGPQEDYIVKIVYDLLQQAQLWVPRIYLDTEKEKKGNYKNNGFEDTFFSSSDYPMSYSVARKIFIAGDNQRFVSSDNSINFKTYLNNNERYLDLSVNEVFLKYFNIVTIGNYISLKQPWRISIDDDFTESNLPNNSNLVNWNWIRYYINEDTSSENRIEAIRTHVDGIDNEIDAIDDRIKVLELEKITQTSGKISDYYTELQKSIVQGKTPYHYNAGSNDYISIVSVIFGTNGWLIGGISKTPTGGLQLIDLGDVTLSSTATLVYWQEKTTNEN